MESLLIEALGYAKLGLPVFPLAKLSKVPLKNSKGYLDATTDEANIFTFFSEIEPLANIGISLIDTNYFVIDCDNHQEEQDGLKSLMELSAGESLPEDVVTVKTPNGIHFWFEQPKHIEIKNQIGFRNGLDIIKNFIVAPPSRVKRKDGSIGTYQVVNGSLDNIGEAPAWLVRAITSNQQAKLSDGSYVLDFNDTNKPKTFFTAKFMTELMKGTTVGSRNSWITQQFGRMVSLGMSLTVAYEWIRLVNENFIDEPISDDELNKIVLSITKREQQKLARAERSD